MLTPWAESSAHAAIAAINPPKPAAASGLLHGALDGEGEDGEDDDDDDNKIGPNLKSGDQANDSKPTWSENILPS